MWLPLTRPLLGTWPTTLACALTGSRTSDPLVPRLALNPLSHTSEGGNSFKKGAEARLETGTGPCASMWM